MLAPPGAAHAAAIGSGAADSLPAHGPPPGAERVNTGGAVYEGPALPAGGLEPRLEGAGPAEGGLPAPPALPERVPQNPGEPNHGEPREPHGRRRKHERGPRGSRRKPRTTAEAGAAGAAVEVEVQLARLQGQFDRGFISQVAVGESVTKCPSPLNILRYIRS
jgi:hypothetical protein